MTNLLSAARPLTTSCEPKLAQRPPHQNTLESRIRLIAQQKLHCDLSEQQKADLQKGFKLAHSWSWSAESMKTLLSTLPEETIKAFLLQMMATGNEKECDTYLQLGLSFLSENSLLTLSGLKTANMAAASFRIRGLTKSTALRTGLGKEGQAIWKEYFIEAKHFTHHLLELLSSLIGLNILERKKHGRHSDAQSSLGSWEAAYKLEAYWQLILYPVTVFGAIYSYIQLKLAAAFLTSVTIVATLTGIVAHNRYWKPCPLDHAGLKNLSIEILSESSPIYPRWDILKKIEAAFQAKKGVILIGKPGTGKSWIARSFVEQALAGKICTFIKDPQVFTCNGSNFKGFEGPSLTSIEDRFRRHQEQVVFFFDEFHSLFNHEGMFGNGTSEQIKTFCEDFKYVIGATTTDEYEKYIKDQPAIVDRRFEVIHVDPMTTSQIKISLSRYLESGHSKIAFDPSVFDYIIDKANEFNPKTSSIDAAHSLLNCALQKMTSVVHSALDERIVRLENELGMLEQQLINEEISPELNGLTDQFVEKKAALETAKLELATINRRTQQMQNMEGYHQNLKKQSYQLANPDVALSPGSELSRKWTNLHARIHLVGQFVAMERESLGLPRCLNQALVDSILAERTKRTPSAIL